MSDLQATPVKKSSRQARVLLWARRAVFLYAALGALYLGWRFELMTLPAEGVSPLREYRPGTRLLVDRSHREGREGEALLYRDDLGRLLLGRLATTPSGETRSGLWLVTDAEGGELPDSRTLGPISPERVVGRVVCALPTME